MATNDSTTSGNASPNETEQEGINGTISASNVMFELWDRTKHELTPKELEWFASSGEQSMRQLLRISEVMEGS